VTLASVLGIAIYLMVHFDVYPDFMTALRYGLQRGVDRHHPGFASRLQPVADLRPLWMLFLCSFATCAGSTGGGIKMIGRSSSTSRCIAS
jgi:trk system potassium uptake protein TrkH